MPLWTVEKLSQLRAWYDASDAATITESGGLISAWNDKSGGGYHVSASGSARPTYTSSGLNSKSVVTFGGTQFLVAATASHWVFLHDTTGSTILAVWKAGNVSNPDAGHGLLGTAANSGSRGLQITYDDRSSASRNDQLRSFVYRSTVTAGLVSSVFTADGAHAANTATLISVASDPGNATVGSRQGLRINGGAETANNASTSTADTGNPLNPLSIGSAGIGSGGTHQLPMVGYAAEIVICNAKISDQNRQLTEGYLAWKWGLEGNLPSDHPYKNAAPTYGDNRRRQYAGAYGL